MLDRCGGGLSGAIDDAIAVYADDRKAILVSHDKAFAERHRLNTLGKHVWLRCDRSKRPPP
jgi:predicted nuclease of predicted toxin-antitoxin system